MKKALAGAGAVLAAGVTVLGLALAPSAMATPTVDDSGPDSVACAQANAAVLRAALAANAIADRIDAGQDQVITDLKAKVVAAQTVYDTAYAAYQATPTPGTLAALVSAQGVLDDALGALKNAPGVSSTLKAELAGAQAALKVTIERRVKACDFVIVTPTVTPTPPVTVTVTPPPPVTLPKAIDTGYAA